MNRGQLVLGILLIVLGLMFLLGTLFQINVWAICWPLGLILVGVWMVLRPSLTGPGKASEVTLLGDLRRRGSWVARDEEIWLGIADVELDYTEAEIPLGETRVVLYGFVGDVDIVAPRSVGVAVHASGFVVDSDLFGRDMDAFFSPVEATSENYASADRRLRIEMTGFVVDLKVKQF